MILASYTFENLVIPSAKRDDARSLILPILDKEDGMDVAKTGWLGRCLGNFGITAKNRPNGDLELTGAQTVRSGVAMEALEALAETFQDGGLIYENVEDCDPVRYRVEHGALIEGAPTWKEGVSL